jgi:hypothetical protein
MRLQATHNDNPVDEFTGTFKAQSEKAILVIFSGVEVWLPRSEIEIYGEELRGGEISVIVPKWLADKKGLS